MKMNNQTTTAKIGDRGQYPNGFCWTVEAVQNDTVVILDDDDTRATITAAQAAEGIAALDTCKASWAAREARDAREADRVTAEKGLKIADWISRLGGVHDFRVLDDSDESYAGIRVCATDGTKLMECRAYGLRKEWLGLKNRSELVEIFGMIA